MKLTNAEIFNSKGSFQKLLSQRLPIKTSYKLLGVVSKVNNQLTIIEAARSKLVEMYGQPDPKRTELYRVTPDCPGCSKFMQEFGELMRLEVELDIQPVSLPDTLEIEPSVLLVLDKFIEIKLEVKP